MAQHRQHRVALSFRRFTEIHAGGISIITKLLASCALAALIFAAAPQTLKAAHTDEQCPLLNATLRGTYMVTGTGTIVGLGPASAVGTITYDGKGNSVNTFTVSANGAISKATVTGPYTVNADCTGSLAQSDGTHYDFVVNPDGSTVFWIETDDGTVISGTEIRFKHSTELVESRGGDSVKITPGGAATERVNIRKRTAYRPREGDLTPSSKQVSHGEPSTR